MAVAKEGSYARLCTSYLGEIHVIRAAQSTGSANYALPHCDNPIRA